MRPGHELGDTKATGRLQVEHRGEAPRGQRPERDRERIGLGDGRVLGVRERVGADDQSGRVRAAQVALQVGVGVQSETPSEPLYSSVALTMANVCPLAATWAQSIAAPPGCW